MLPKLLGPYVTFGVAKMGTGATQRQSEQHLKWFAGISADNLILVQPMGDDFALSGLVKVVAGNDFFINYFPDSRVFEKNIKPDMQALSDWLGPKGSEAPDKTPNGKIGRMFSGFLAIIRGKPTTKIKPEDYDIMREMLQTGMEMNIISNFQRQISAEAISERKQGHYEQALSYYEKCIEVGGKDDHLLFNLARVHYEMGNITAARDSLEEALEISPDLAPAKKFLLFINCSDKSA